VYSNSLAIP